MADSAAAHVQHDFFDVAEVLVVIVVDVVSNERVYTTTCGPGPRRASGPEAFTLYVPNVARSS